MSYIKINQLRIRLILMLSIKINQEGIRFILMLSIKMNQSRTNKINLNAIH